jgi:hypothetical protein
MRLLQLKLLLLKYTISMYMPGKISESFLMFRENPQEVFLGLGLKGYELALEWFVANNTK